MQDRAMQALHLLALEPVAETRADPNSYGFRPYRAARDAAAQCFVVLSRRCAAGWVLDCDISACFDKIKPEWMLANIPMDKALLRKWLNAGYIDGNTWHASEAGTPQGSPISPTLANMALDGMETRLLAHFRSKGSNHRSKVHLIRYADDFVITGTSPEVLTETKEIIENFLAERGLVLSEEKTCMRRIEEGFDFLGWNIRKYDGTLLIKPAARNVAAILRKIRTIIKGAAGLPQAYVINQLNPVIRGWAEYHRNQVAKDTFAAVDSAIWELLWRWARRRHPNKSRRWVKGKYFPREGTRQWVFRAENKDKDERKVFVRLLNAADMPIQRHRKIKANANPFDPAWDSYFAERRGKLTYRMGRPEQRSHTPETTTLVAPVTRGFAEA
jgi:RNA-directed DNA polymerase